MSLSGILGEQEVDDMGFLDKAKAAAEQAAAKAKEGVEEVQARRELSQAYNELGKATLELVESGEITHPRLAPLAEKARGLIERVEDDGNASDRESAGSAPAASDPDAPPATTP